MTAEKEQLETLIGLAREARFCMLTTVDSESHLVSRPMTLQEVDLDAELWFIATRDSRKVEHLRADSTAAVTISSDSSWVSMAGVAEVVDDVSKLRELWSTFAEAWIPEGPEDPRAILIRVDVRSAEYWDSPGGRVASVVSLVKSKLTGQPYDGGEHDVIPDV